MKHVCVAARIGAGVVARLANILDIACIERLASTNSGSNPGNDKSEYI